MGSLTVPPNGFMYPSRDRPYIPDRPLSEAVRNGVPEPSSGRNLPFDGGASVAVEKVSRER